VRRDARRSEAGAHDRRRLARGHDGAVTNWGYLLLAVYVGLGLSDVPRAKAVALAAVVTTIVIAYAMVRIGAGAY